MRGERHQLHWIRLDHVEPRQPTRGAARRRIVILLIGGAEREQQVRLALRPDEQARQVELRRDRQVGCGLREIESGAEVQRQLRRLNVDREGQQVGLVDEHPRQSERLRRRGSHRALNRKGAVRGERQAEAGDRGEGRLRIHGGRELQCAGAALGSGDREAAIDDAHLEGGRLRPLHAQRRVERSNLGKRQIEPQQAREPAEVEAWPAQLGPCNLRPSEVERGKPQQRLDGKARQRCD